MAASPPEAGDAGDEEVGDSTICSFLGPFSLSSEHSELGEAEEVAEVARRPRCQSLGLRMSNSAFFLRNCLSSGMTFGSGLLLLLLLSVASFLASLVNLFFSHSGEAGVSFSGEAGVSSIGEAGVSATGDIGVSTVGVAATAGGDSGVSKSPLSSGFGDSGDSSRSS